MDKKTCACLGKKYKEQRIILDHSLAKFIKEEELIYLPRLKVSEAIDDLKETIDELNKGCGFDIPIRLLLEMKDDLKEERAGVVIRKANEVDRNFIRICGD